VQFIEFEEKALELFALELVSDSARDETRYAAPADASTNRRSEINGNTDRKLSG